MQSPLPNVEVKDRLDPGFHELVLVEIGGALVVVGQKTVNDSHDNGDGRGLEIIENFGVVVVVASESNLDISGASLGGGGEDINAVVVGGVKLNLHWLQGDVLGMGVDDLYADSLTSSGCLGQSHGKWRGVSSDEHRPGRVSETNTDRRVERQVLRVVELAHSTAGVFVVMSFEVVGYVFEEGNRLGLSARPCLVFPLV